MLRVENLTLVARGHPVLTALDLHVAPRELVALVGPTAAGKTAALDCLAGLRPFTAGRITVAGCDLAREPHAAAAQHAYVPAHPAFPSAPTGLAHARAHAAHLGRRIPDPVLRTALTEAGLSPAYHDRPVADYPPPQRRQLAHTLALLQTPAVLLLDEPAADLDAADTTALVASLRRLRRRDLAIVLATRDLAFAHRVATRLVLLEQGSVVETLDPHASHRTHEADSYLATLLT